MEVTLNGYALPEFRPRKVEALISISSKFRPISTDCIKILTRVKEVKKSGTTLPRDVKKT